MKSQVHYFKVGLFVVACVAVLIAGIIGINADAIRSDALLMETYLNESVQGLAEGSALMHRGVDIGRIVKITFVPAEYPMGIDTPEFEKYGRYVMVVMAVDPRKVSGMGDDQKFFETMMRNQVKEGMRLKLTYQGITGLSLLETEYGDPNAPYMQPAWTPKHLYIPSMPSLITSFTNAVDGVFQRLQRIDFEGLARKAELTLDSIHNTVNDINVPELSGSILTLLEEVRQTNLKLQGVLDSTQTLAQSDIPLALEEFSGALDRLDLILKESEPDVDMVLANLNILTQNLRDLSEMIKDDPASLFLSRPPERSEVVK